MLERFIGQLAEVLGIAKPLPEKSTPDDVDATFASLLGRVAVKRRVVVLLDALNQFDATPRCSFIPLILYRKSLWRRLASVRNSSEREPLLDRPAQLLQPYHYQLSSRPVLIYEGSGGPWFNRTSDEWDTESRHLVHADAVLFLFDPLQNANFPE